MQMIKENALFIADSHYPHHGDAFLTLLQKLDSGEIVVEQLFLMGDNFDLLFGYNDYILTFAEEAVLLLQRLSQKMEIHYFEGNHDFCLKHLFPKIAVYNRVAQPVEFSFKDKTVSISHGDKYATGVWYDLYTLFLRNPVTLRLLRPFEKKIIDFQMQRLSHKNICHDFKNFEKRVEKITRYYKEADIVIEGHYHQAKKIGKYISLPSLACQGEIAVVENSTIVFKRL